ncbi:MAG: L-2-amino-thiazoline-4-carboxylic acid hydrolase [Chloroflexota bacterium]
MAGDDIQEMIDNMPVLARRRIEAMVLGPMIRAFQEEVGEDRANRIARQVIEDLAKEQGARLREKAGGGDIDSYVASKGAWTANNALEIEVVRKDLSHYDYNVTRCRYAEMYRELGMEDLGYIFSCGRDFNFPKGFNSNMKLRRTQTIMEGASYCDFRYELASDREDEDCE